MTNAQAKQHYVIVRTEHLHMLPPLMDVRLADGVWETAGGPFYDGERREWCQVIVRPARTERAERPKR